MGSTRDGQHQGHVALGSHATLEETDEQGLRIVLTLPFRLESLAEAELQIAPSSLCLAGARPEEKLSVDLPEGFRLDPDAAAAKFSKKRQQLVVTSPNAAVKSAASEEPTAVDGASGDAAAPAPPDDDDDDLPPPLDSARSVPVPARGSSQSRAAAAVDSAECNEAAELLMQRALLAREQKKQETEEARRSAAKSAGGLKRGFLSGGGSKKGASSGRERRGEQEPPVTYVAGTGDAETARRESLKLPEVQQALQQGVRNLQSDQSWMTPELMKALQCRPDLLKGLSNPKVMQAIQLLQTDPEKAKVAYQDDAEVTEFLKEFSSLMATHFGLLGKEQKPAGPSGASRSPEQARALPATSSSPAQSGAPSDAGPQLLDPKVAAVLQDREVKELIETLRAGRPLEMHELLQERPQLFQKVKLLLDNGLLGLER